MTHAGVFGVFVNKFCHWEKLCPVIQLPIYKGTKICFHHTILLFYLPVYLRVEYGRELFLDTKEVIKGEPKFIFKNCSVFIDDRIQEAIMLHYHIDNYFC